MADFLSTGQYADRVGVTDQTVRNWCEAGTLPASRDERGRWRIAPGEADNALARNRRASGHGGTRRGAGRPADHGRHDALGFRDAETVAAIGKREESPPGALHASELLRFTREEIRAIVAVGHRVGLGQAQFDLLKTWEATRKIQLDNDEKCGTLVKADDVADTWRSTLQMLNIQLEAIAARLAASVPRWLPQTVRHEVIDLLTAARVDPDVITAVAGLLEEPEGMSGRVRALVGAEIDAARRSMIESEG